LSLGMLGPGCGACGVCENQYACFAWRDGQNDPCNGIARELKGRSKLVSMRKTLWMIGLSIALLMFGGFFVLCCVGLITRRHLNLTGWAMLFGSGSIAWIVLRQMLLGAGELTGELPVARDPWPELVRAIRDHGSMTMVEVRDDADDGGGKVQGPVSGCDG